MMYGDDLQVAGYRREDREIKRKLQPQIIELRFLDRQIVAQSAAVITARFVGGLTRLVAAIVMMTAFVACLRSGVFVAAQFTVRVPAATERRMYQ